MLEISTSVVFEIDILGGFHIVQIVLFGPVQGLMGSMVIVEIVTVWLS